MKIMDLINYKLCFNTVEEMKFIAKFLNDNNFEVYNYSVILNSYSVGSWRCFKWNEENEIFSRSSSRREWDGEELSFDELVVKFNLPWQKERGKKVLKSDIDPFNEEDWGYVKEGYIREGDECISNLENIKFENGDIEFDEFDKDGHDIFIAKDYDDVGYRAYMLITFLKQGGEWYVFKDGDKTILTYRHEYYDQVMKRGEYRIHYNYWYEDGKIHGSKKEKVLKLYPYDKSFDNITVEHIKPVIDYKDFKIGDRVKVKETSEIGNITHIARKEIDNFELDDLATKINIERKTVLPWICNPIIVQFGDTSDCFNSEDLIKLKSRKFGEFDPFGEEIFDIDEYEIDEIVEKNNNEKIENIKVDPFGEENWEFELLPVGTKIKIISPYFLKSVWMHEMGKIAEITGYKYNNYEVTVNNGRSWFWIPFEFAEKIQENKIIETKNNNVKMITEFKLFEKQYDPVIGEYYQIKYFLTGDLVPVKIIKRNPNNTYLVSFDVEGSLAKGAPEASIRNSDIVSPYQPIRNPVGSGFVSANTNMMNTQQKQVSNDMYL